MISRFLLRRSVLVPALFFAAFLTVGLAISGDFGVYWDEPAQIHLGTMVYRYIVKGDTELLTHIDRYHGLWYETVMSYLQYHPDPRQIHLIRRRVNFLAFFAGVLAFFWLGCRVFRDWKAGLSGASLLIISPRIFADAFYNTNDFPFLISFIFAMLSLSWVVQRQNIFTLSIHAFITAAAITCRAAGTFIIFFTALALLFLGFQRLKAAGENFAKPKEVVLPLLGWSAFYGLSTLVFVVALWPSLWHNPLVELVAALREAGKFDWGGTVLYLGQDVSAASLPWHYLPVWIGISTPPIYLLAMAVGSVIALKTLAAPGRRPLITRAGAGIALAWFFVPSLTAIGLRAVIFDSWRHMFFIYPGLILLAVAGLRGLGRWFASRLGARRKVGWALVAGAVALTLLPVVDFMVRYHPTQNLYFNGFAAPENLLKEPQTLFGMPDMQVVRGRFETDYYGLTYRPLLEELLRRDSSPVISIYPAQYVGRHAYLILPESERRRLQYDGDETATYFLTNYRGHPQDYPFPDEVFSYWVGNAKMATVFRLR